MRRWPSAKSLELDPAAALEAAGGFRGLPHRQQELGEVAGVLFVDDSISTIPESTLAALAVYAGRDITVILGGHDRGIDYGKLVERAVGGAAKAVICLGDSGERIYRGGNGGRDRRATAPPARSTVRSRWGMPSRYARQVTPPGGVVLLSPAAPSYGHYRDYIERGRDFAAKSGFAAIGGAAAIPQRNSWHPPRAGTYNATSRLIVKGTMCGGWYKG